jgi:membrane-associated phospholipid phosphatase
VPAALFDPLVIVVAISLLGAFVAGPAAVYGLGFVPERWHKRTQWLLILGAVAIAVVADLLVEGPGGSGPIVYVLAVLPGLLAYLAFRTLLASALVSLLPLYFVIGYLTRDWPTHTPAIALDRAIPVQPEWMFVYGSLYVFVALLPLFVVRQAALFRRAMQAYLTVMLVAYAGFLLYPTLAPRPVFVPGDGFSAWGLRLAYAIDPPHGCFPSLHVAYSFVSALTCYRVHRGVGIAAGVWAALIGVSTVFTKQHYAVDVIAGAAAAFVAYAVFLRSHPREANAEIDRRRAPLRALGVAAVFGVMVAGFWIAYLMGMQVG